MDTMVAASSSSISNRKYLRSASAADPAHPGIFYCPYSVVLLPEIDRALLDQLIHELL